MTEALAGAQHLLTSEGRQESQADQTVIMDLGVKEHGPQGLVARFTCSRAWR